MSEREEVVLCGASAYNKKFYLNQDFKGLPDSIKDELKIMCVLFTEDIGGIFQVVFDEDGVSLIHLSPPTRLRRIGGWGGVG